MLCFTEEARLVASSEAETYEPLAFLSCVEIDFVVNGRLGYCEVDFRPLSQREFEASLPAKERADAI